jgi:ribosomal protein L37E
MSLHVCPACGFTGLQAAPWRRKLNDPGDDRLRTSHEICARCGIEFGRDDWAGGNLERRAEFYLRWRERWIRSGMRWFKPELMPDNWQAQLERLESS